MDTAPVLLLVQSIPREKRIIKWVSEVKLQMVRKFLLPLQKKNHELFCPVDNTHFLALKDSLF